MYAAQQTSFGIMEFVWDLKNLGILSGNLGNLDWYMTLYPPYFAIPMTGNIGKIFVTLRNLLWLACEVCSRRDWNNRTQRK